uniref:TRP C-terminal domain-containing protein n=1 Tax=Chromera velia CCMP2878 TaxID=1169474 RepID=A0A0G4I8V5_9ALVE|eukprot:Cvel_1996.t1-p1 / transcript=Cvel_1996.t1 / gene=Cvel_1996 / organism=Chromera_velia_CCMP2878 / gene_product=hypothetical protein / transcript_product=hypothetical protein / location=Cvel_scaffold76:44629-49397(-) / protein_length=519 / sequence_SO=supercontig / SO=protein_coding / is_pseudo=false
MFDTYRVSFPNWVDRKALFPYPGFPSITDVLSFECLLEGHIRRAGYSDDDEVMLLLRLSNTVKPIASLIFLSIFCSVSIATIALVQRRREAQAIKREMQRKSGGSGGSSRRILRLDPKERAEIQRMVTMRKKEGDNAEPEGGVDRDRDAPGSVSVAQARQLERLMLRRQANARIFDLFRYKIVVGPGESFFGTLARNVSADLVPVFIVTYFLMLDGTVEELLALIRCKPLGTGLERRLDEAPSITCDSALYTKWVWVAATGLVVIGLLIPLLLAVAMARGARTLRGLRAREKEGDFRRRFGFLMQGYDWQFVFWELVIVGRKVLTQMTLAYYPGDEPVMRLYQVTVLAVFCLLAQLRVQPFSRQSNGILNSLEDHALATWVISLALFECVYAVKQTDEVNFFIALIAIIVNLVFIVRAGWVIVSGHAFAFYAVLVELEEAEDPEEVIPEFYIRYPVLLCLPLFRVLARPVKALSDSFPVPVVTLSEENPTAAFVTRMENAGMSGRKRGGYKSKQELGSE